ncbi:MAG: YHS domain-containing protein [wastewater metagenome]|nr:YHS domain-containing protein [Candidatus Loosdrechtia aerotolerans]
MLNKNILFTGIFFLTIIGCASTNSTVKKEEPNVVDPVCAYFADMGCINITVDENTPRSTYGGMTYYFCSRDCKVDFDKNPSKYLKTAVVPEDVIDYVCRAKIEEQGGFVTCVCQDNTYYFCSDRCRAKFMADPDRYGMHE